MFSSFLSRPQRSNFVRNHWAGSACHHNNLGNPNLDHETFDPSKKTGDSPLDLSISRGRASCHRNENLEQNFRPRSSPVFHLKYFCLHPACMWWPPFLEYKLSSTHPSHFFIFVPKLFSMMKYKRLMYKGIKISMMKNV